MCGNYAVTNTAKKAKSMSRLHQLIVEKYLSTGKDKKSLILDIGYKNIDKGLRRYQSIKDGRNKADVFFIQGLARALNCSDTEISECIAHDWQKVRIRENQNYETNFAAHAVLIADRQRPQHLFIAGLFHVEKQMKINFPAELSPLKFVHYVLDRLPIAVPCFGCITAFVINYTPIKAVEFNLQGAPITVHTTAKKVVQINSLQR